MVDVRPADSVGAALAAADTVGYPVALKTVAVLHKSDVGGVVLDIADETALSVAYAAMADSSRAGGDRRTNGRCRRRGLGRNRARRQLRAVADRRGGRHAGGACSPTAWWPARRYRTRARCSLLDGLRIRPLLAGWRGAPAVDIDALADVIVRVLATWRPNSATWLTRSRPTPSSRHRTASSRSMHLSRRPGQNPRTRLRTSRRACTLARQGHRRAPETRCRMRNRYVDGRLLGPRARRLRWRADCCAASVHATTKTTTYQIWPATQEAVG